MSTQVDGLIAAVEDEAKAHGNEKFLEAISLAFVPQGVEVPKPESVFAMDGISVFSKKSISTLIGKAKAGKTTCTAWVTAQILNNKLKVLWIDTEQGLYYSSRTQSWVLSIQGRIENKDLSFYDLKIHAPNVRIEMVEHLIQTFEPDMVILDGIRDLVFDINEPKEATNVTGSLMRWADTFDCHILSILHQNKGNEHARGHLGSEMINKSETVIKVEKDEQKKLTVCTPEFTRGEPFPIFAFDRDAAGMPQIVNYQPTITASESNARKQKPADIDELTHKKMIIQAFNGEKQLTYAELLTAISATFEMYGTPMGISKCKAFIVYYEQKNLLSKHKEKTKSMYSIT